MIHLLVQYFIKTGAITLPGIGSLQLSINESFWDDGKLIAPNEYIILDHKKIDTDLLLLEFLSKELEISKEESNTQFIHFLEPILSQQVASLNFGNLGTLHKNGTKITWNSIYKSDVYFNNFDPSNYNAEIADAETLSQKDNSWLIWSLIIFIASFALIIYKNIAH